VVIRNENWKEVLSSLLVEFNHRVIDFYTKEDQVQGGIQSTNRFGEDRFFGFVTASAGVMSLTEEYFDSFQPLLTNLIKLKQRTKRDKLIQIAHQYKENICLYTLTEGNFIKAISEPSQTK